MKNSLSILLVAGVFISCSGTKKIASTPAPIEVIEEKVIITNTPQTAPEVEAEIIEIQDITAETSNEEVAEIAESEIVAPQLEEVEVIDTPIIVINHATFDALLKRHVSPAGNVNYDGIKKEWKSLREYITSLGENMPTDTWSTDEKLAYWMNAYNAMTIDLILRNYPLESIKDIKDPWDQRLWKLGEKWVNLNQIEHEILRKMGDPRIHFGINCASFSCPPLLNEAFTAQKVDGQLDKLARQFVNDSKRNTITTNSIEVSKIFNWFAKDFKTNGSLIDFLNIYSETAISPNAKKRYMDYDWTLNK